MREKRGKKRKLLGRMAYILGVVFLVGYVLGSPPWVGASYTRSYDDPTTMQRSGTFGLRELETNAPLWDPPRAQSSSIQSTLRLPWQSAESRYHVEISSMAVAWRIAIGMVVLGLLLRFWNGISARNEPDRFVNLAWSCSLGIAISLLGLLIFGAFTAGYGLTDAIVVGGIASGGALGLVYGTLVFRRERTRPSLFTVTQLAWFAVGLFAASMIMMAVGGTSNFLGNHLAELTMLGTRAPSEGSSFVRVVEGIGIAIFGVAAAWLAAWSRMPRGLVAGLWIGSLLLGGAFALSF